jgi:uncharacterized protein (TIGR02145 family)
MRTIISNNPVITVLLLMLLISCEKRTGSGLPVDADGNEYDTVVIGTQTWLATNLITTKYINGDPIKMTIENETWKGMTRGAYCWYENNISNKESNGALYNWYAAVYNWYAARSTDFLCPVGYRVPTIADWTTLAEFMIDAPEEVKLSFKANSTGWRVWDGSFSSGNSSWWIAAQGTSEIHAPRFTPSFEIIDMPKASGYYVRCVKNK